DPPARGVPSHGRRRGISHRRLRGPRDPDAPGRWLALGPDRRRARSDRRLPWRGALRPAPGVAFDGPLHPRPARLPDAPRAPRSAGAGMGAVLRPAPQSPPAETGTVTGLVGAMGGLGGFFPPLLLGVFRDTIGIAWPGFILLAATSIALLVVNMRVFVPRQEA